MANYDNKLGEWFKQVEQQEQALKAKKTVGSPEVTEEAPKPTPVETPRTPQIRRMEIEGPAREASAAVVATVDTVEVVADTTLAGGTDESAEARLFTEEDVPPVEDFFTFLNRSSEQPVVEEVEDHVFELTKDQGVLSLSEGTGEPRPISAKPEPPVQPIAETPQIQARVEVPQPPVHPVVETPRTQARVETSLPPKPAPAPEMRVEPVVEPQGPAVADSGAQANWDRVPRHLQTLFATPSQEVAQHSYKAFKENREELIQRLLDPTVSLEEAARVLNVCPTTVRRYTNRGVLRHYRTAGNQRRFKLSDVLAFMDNGRRRGSADEAGSED